MKTCSFKLRDFKPRKSFSSGIDLYHKATPGKPRTRRFFRTGKLSRPKPKNKKPYFSLVATNSCRLATEKENRVFARGTCGQGASTTLLILNSELIQKCLQHQRYSGPIKVIVIHFDNRLMFTSRNPMVFLIFFLLFFSYKKFYFFSFQYTFTNKCTKRDLKVGPNSLHCLAQQILVLSRGLPV